MKTIKGNLSNGYQGAYKRVLCVCSAGMLRSPTMAHTLCKAPYNYNTRSVGIEDSYALNTLTVDLVTWADEIVCADKEHEDAVKEFMHRNYISPRPIKCLYIPDIYEYRNPKLIKLIKERYNEHLKSTG